MYLKQVRRAAWELARVRPVLGDGYGTWMAAVNAIAQVIGEQYPDRVQAFLDGATSWAGETIDGERFYGTRTQLERALRRRERAR